MTKPRKYKRPQTPPKELRWHAAAKFCQLLERIDSRLLAADGPVPQVCALTVATPDEVRWLYRLAKVIARPIVESEPPEALERYRARMGK